MAKKILFGFILIVGLFLIYVALQPASYTVSREVTINSSPEVIFPYINDSQKMNSWNPWTALDPNVKITFSGPEAGVGAKTSWVGGDQLGVGSATVIESAVNQFVKTKIEYVKPFEMSQNAEISLTPTGSQTLVRWSVSGEHTFIGRIFCVFMNMDKVVGGTFEKGLTKLKKTIESN